MSECIQIGKTAPNFITAGVFNSQIGKIRLSDYHGKKYVVLVFYPANFTSISPTELVRINDKITEFRKLSTQILAISVDSPFSHLHWLSSKKNQGGLEKLNYPLISDLNRVITKKYNLLTSDGFSLPGLFIIDKEGVIQHATINNLSFGRSVDETLRTLKAIQHVQKNPDEVCPAGWEEGDQTMNPDPVKSKVYFSNVG